VTGAGFRLVAPRVTAEVDPVGAGLRRLTVAGVAVVESYAPGLADRPGVGAPFAAGATLFPWPNRVRDGRWSWQGAEHRLSIDEPQRNTANHGLVRTRRFRLLSARADSVTLGIDVGDDRGFPFSLGLTVAYTLRPDGIQAVFTVHNRGTRSAPFALGSHPYLRVGTIETDDLVLHIAAGSTLGFDDRLLPIGTRSVAGTEADPAGLALGGVELGHCFGDLIAVPGGGFRHRLVGPDGTGVELETDERFRWVQVYTATDFPRETGLVRAVAIEPMTAPPDALNSGIGLTTLQPGETWRASWSLRTLPKPPGRGGQPGSGIMG
jgi:aldose 1-epimerase